MVFRKLLLLSFLLATLPFFAHGETKTWSFEWNKSHSDATSQGFYYFGTSSVSKDVYTTELNGLVWNISSDGTKKYAYTANSGQTIGTNGEPSTHTSLYTSALAGKIKAVRVSARTNKATNQADLSVKVNGGSYKTAAGTTAQALTNTIAEYSFTPSAGEQEGKIEINIDPTSDAKGTLYIKKIEIDYEYTASAVAAPSFTPAAGTYDAPQSVTLSAKGLSNGSYKIYYTTDGSNPRIEGTRKLYDGAISVDTTTTIKAATFVNGEYSDVVEAKYVIRKDPKLSFYKTSTQLVSGKDGYADLLNPYKVEPITYTSSNPDVCSVSEIGELYSSYVTATQTVTITASFAGNDEYLPATAAMTVTVVAQEPLKTPVVTPAGGTFDKPVDVKITTDDERAVTIWYSTTASSKEEFDDDNTKSTVIEGNTATLTIDKSCRLYVMTRGYNVNSAIEYYDFRINEPLKASFTTNRSFTALYEENFDTQEGTADWTFDSGWKLADKNFKSVDTNDKKSAAIGYNDGNGSSVLTSPELTISDGENVEFYAYFSGVYLVWGSWQFNVIDTETGSSTQLFDAFNWAQANAYTGPAWNRFSFPLDKYSGKKVKFQFNFKFGGEDLALDGFRLLKKNDDAGISINLFEGESIIFENTSEGSPDSLSWTFEGGTPEQSSEASPKVTYNTAGSYRVTLQVFGGENGKETDETTVDNYVVVSKRAPEARIGLPEEGYESPFVGVFIPRNVPVQFRDQSSGNPTSWKWTFQNTDKLSSTDQNPTVTYLDKGRFSVGLHVENEAGSSNDMLAYAVQAGGAQNVWNIGLDENKSIEKVSLGWYGNYAGTNWLGIEKFAEHYKAPLADATIDSVFVYFASTTSINPDADIPMSINKVSASGQPGDVLATTSVRAGSLKYDADSVVATVFHFAEPVEIKKGEEFFVVIGPFPNGSLNESPYTSDDIAIFCVRRPAGARSTAWQYLEDQDDKGQGLGTYQWHENVDDPTSMAISPVITYDKPAATGIGSVYGTADTGSRVVAVYTVSGQQTNSISDRGVYIIKFSDGTARKVLGSTLKK